MCTYRERERERERERDRGGNPAQERNIDDATSAPTVDPDASGSVFCKGLSFCCLLIRLQQVPSWLEAGKGNHLAFPELAEDIIHRKVDMMKKIEGKMPMSPSKVEVQRQMYELFVNLVIYLLPQHCISSKCHMVAGVLIIYCWEGVTLLESLSEALRDIPTPFKPLCQPMGNVDVNQLKQSGAFSQVLDLAQAGAKWQETVQPDHPAIQEMARLRQKWSSSPEEVASDGCVAGVVRQVLEVDGALRVAWSGGAVYVYKPGQIIRHGAEGQTSFQLKGLDSFGHLNHLDFMAVAGKTLVGSYSSPGVEKACSKIYVARFSGTEVAPIWTEQVEDAAGQYPKGFSLGDSRAYFCRGHAVWSLDLKLQTKRMHEVIGKHGAAGCSDMDQLPTELLLKNPSDTAVVGSCLFVLDAGNQRVLCWDMKRNECQVAFKGSCPTQLAAYHGGIFVYDQLKNKIFHASRGATGWESRHVLGTGKRGYSPEGLAPLSTNLGLIRSMAVGHAGELVFLSQYDDQISPVVRGFRMSAESDALPAGPLCAKVTAENAIRTSEKDALVSHLPTCGVAFQSFPNQVTETSMVLSGTLPRDKNKITLETWRQPYPVHMTGLP